MTVSGLNDIVCPFKKAADVVPYILVVIYDQNSLKFVISPFFRREHYRLLAGISDCAFAEHFHLVGQGRSRLYR